MESLVRDLDAKVTQALATMLVETAPTASELEGGIKSVQEAVSDLDRRLWQLSMQALATPEDRLNQSIAALKEDIFRKQVVLTKCQRQLAQFETLLQATEQANRQSLMNN
ncbi:hypothetical protein H4R34_002780 [Dimargaris verticillata]|uniref:Uncharacterized protein n=1 Tax=Dimargaris verticillata TaxID=2761393 RepID=A0A9W8ED93_9FUNG|nr:hypothetical protein H4R34_002780 [Dimargaris verticillata]